MSMWDDVKKNLVEWYGMTHDKTTEVAKVTSLRYDKFGISRDIERQLGELGNLVYTALKEGAFPDPDSPGLTATMARLEALEVELKAKEQEIEAIRARGAEARASRGAATVDPGEGAAASDPREAPDGADALSGPVVTRESDWNGDNDHPQMGD